MKGSLIKGFYDLSFSLIKGSLSLSIAGFVRGEKGEELKDSFWF